ncbi:conjugal transfer protein [Zunongwangia sp. SCSIO 43204]|uniref:Conjugal transfer protein I n=1 Tax=Zunongwangia atlantica 22II14-10F7 TaxID=1185767 RepID=A0A1Y1T6F4_9FLAO|nr:MULTISPECIES: conjugal transfer protein [Zunongwangia]ORL46145.1 conjugal transfer protein I [Zunongwangia atlantica 22II14-10F7]UAB84180.1 conjugal transfer protein [Zunongwangia sp. SCSIO 43204]
MKTLLTAKQHLLCITIISFLILIPGNIQAQGMPVYDNTNFISLAQQLIESAKQTSNLVQTVNFLKEQKENLEKVTNVVKQLHAVQEITENNQRLYRMVRDDLREILASPYIRPSEIERVSDAFNRIIETSLEDLSYMESILSSDYLKMSDAERAKILQEKKEASRKMVMEINQKTKRYRDIISFREMQDKINNRENEF